MSIIKRLATTIHASVDRTVASIENHEAIVKATLNESRQALASAKIQLQRVEAEYHQQHNQIQALQQRIDTWTTRAKDIGDKDREKALRCLQERALDQANLDKAEALLIRHTDMQQRMRHQVASLEDRVSELHRQHRELLSRDTVSRANAQLDAAQLNPHSNLDEVFDRWETAIKARELGHEYVNTNVVSTADLDAEMSADEARADLNSELDSLLAEKGQ